MPDRSMTSAQVAVDPWSPWQESSARGAAVVFLLVGALMTALDLLVLPQPVHSRAAALVQDAFPLIQIVLAAVVGSLDRLRLRVPDRCYAAFAAGGAVTISAEAVVTRDASASSQLLLCLPLLFAATQLRPYAGYAITALTIVVHTISVALLLPGDEAARDALYGLLVYGAFGVLLAHGTTAQQRLTAELRRQATVDSLTGLVTRRVLDEAAHGAIVGSLGDQGVALLVVDVDDFKSVNDTYGHPTGDAALVHIAEVVAERARPDDVVGRLGGDELVVLMMGIAHDVAVRRAQELVQAVRDQPLVLPDGTRIPLTVSIGVAQAPRHAAEVTGLYAAADSGLYQAKQLGRDRVGTPA